MNEFDIQFYGLYLTLLLTPSIALLIRRRFTRYDLWFGVVASVLSAISLIFWYSDVSLRGVTTDIVGLYLSYFVTGIAVFKMTAFRNRAAKLSGCIAAFPFFVLPALAIPLFFGVLLGLGDLQTEYETDREEDYYCRVSVYGNATTSTGGYTARVYEAYAVLEYQRHAVNFENTLYPEMTPELSCKRALSAAKKAI
ncbi:hypothetical protein [Spongorhabdus nitratireducens]